MPVGARNPNPTTADARVARNPTNRIQPDVFVKRVSREPHTVRAKAIPVPMTMRELSIIAGVITGMSEFITGF
jgi:hypothetical protein